MARIELVRILIEGFGLGLSTGVYCLAACLPLFFPYLLAENQKELKPNLKAVLELMLGRLLAYLFFGFMVSLAGIHFKAISSTKVFPVTLIFTSILMIAYALSRSLPQRKLCQWLAWHLPLSRFPFFLGLLIGINICPPFLVGLTRLWEMGSLAFGSLFFLAFFMGTSIYMLPLIFAGKLAAFTRLRSIGIWASLISGVYFLVVGITRLVW